VTVRTAQLGVSVNSPGNVGIEVFICPAGATAIVKDIRIGNGSGVVRDYLVLVSTPDGNIPVMKGSLASFQVESQLGGFLVLEPADRLLLLIFSGDVNTEVGMIASGALLDGVAPGQ